MVTVWAVTVLSFVIIQLPPGDYVDAYKGILESMGDMVTEDRELALRMQYGLLDPMYQQYLRWRGLLDVAPAARRPPLQVPSASAMYREQEQNIRFYGVKCRRCGTPQYPIQRVCCVCRTKDEFDPYRFSDKRANLFTYSMDYLGPTPDPPLVLSIIDFDGGGRTLIQMTDRDISKVKPGIPLELSFRLLHVVEGIHNYYWKCLPVRAA